MRRRRHRSRPERKARQQRTHLSAFRLPISMPTCRCTTHVHSNPRVVAASSVNARIPPIPLLDKQGQLKLDDKGKPKSITAAQWLDRNRPVEQMTWAPGLPEIIEDRLLYEGGWLDRPGMRCFNQYLSPAIVPGSADQADRWLEHIRLVYPDDAEHLVKWLAHRVQRPQEKINHAIVLGGSHGIGKDTLIEPVKRAIGPWNCQEASPAQMLGRFNGFLKSVILRISEARDLGEFNRFAFYDHMKAYTASPPDTLRIDEKHLREYSILNVCGVIITTNHKTDGIYLPAEDRRHYVAWSDLLKEDPRFANGYWPGMYAYYENGGAEAVAAYLHQLDIREFDPKAPPPKTPAFWAIVDANRAGEEGELADVIEDVMKTPKAFTLRALRDAADAGLAEWLGDRKIAASSRTAWRNAGTNRFAIPMQRTAFGKFKASDRRCTPNRAYPFRNASKWRAR